MNLVKDVFGQPCNLRELPNCLFASAIVCHVYVKSSKYYGTVIKVLLCQP